MAVSGQISWIARVEVVEQESAVRGSASFASVELCVLCFVGRDAIGQRLAAFTQRIRPHLVVPGESDQAERVAGVHSGDKRRIRDAECARSAAHGIEARRR